MVEVAGKGPALNTRLVWGLMVAIAAADAVGLALTGMSLSLRPFMVTLTTVAAMLTLAGFYSRIRRDARISSLAHMAAVTLAFTMVAAIASYEVTVFNAPLIDPWLISVDHALGLDWPALFGWVSAHRTLHIGLIVLYHTLIPQMVVLLVIFNFLGRFGRGWEMQWLFLVSCIGCLIVSAFWPADGAFARFHIHENEPYVRTVRLLREGTMKIIGQEPIQGLIEFPSLHTTLAIIYAYAARGLKIIFPAFLILNILVVVATPFVGGHHFADIWAGAALALAAIFVVKRMSSAGLLPVDIAG